MSPLPCDVCRGQCCTYAPMTRREFKTIRARYGIPKGAVVLAPGLHSHSGTMVQRSATDSTCAYLTPAGRCGVYEHRPVTCRLYGTIEALPCAYLDPEASEQAAQRILDGLVPTEALLRQAKKMGLR